MDRASACRVVRQSIFCLALLVLSACGGGWNGRLQCAPYAREHSQVSLLHGDAASWWWQAKGRYVRSSVPQPGDVLVFRSTRRLPAGHVSVVRKVKNSRWIIVDHANWEPGRVTRNAPVQDVSAANNWTKVKVWWAPIDGMGKTVYPAYGFIQP
ncbi:CHAP domain-containing protein [Acetobacter thailandicus]|uniref:CHAP domain-containing protein n=1 Tax=Acetobacter thailandicus TaxID=1502842 RepID=A0ABT3QES2_9PROT|nr:CHAP domain-containing protein [Acetobacter thailandicus]MBS0985748.1 CHAP domain-containing protein [Acetobacter thailandicus]MCX2563774.1 CHAP domain-containing protein [Acetobacter thailandicus]NHN95151.1 CHAP domain-containing protein [Acetobacter thailandicus]